MWHTEKAVSHTIRQFNSRNFYDHLLSEWIIFIFIFLTKFPELIVWIMSMLYFIILPYCMTHSTQIVRHVIIYFVCFYLVCHCLKNLNSFKNLQKHFMNFLNFYSWIIHMCFKKNLCIEPVAKIVTQSLEKHKKKNIHVVKHTIILFLFISVICSESEFLIRMPFKHITLLIFLGRQMVCENRKTKHM